MSADESTTCDIGDHPADSATSVPISGRRRFDQMLYICDDHRDELIDKPAAQEAAKKIDDEAAGYECDRCHGTGKIIPDSHGSHARFMKHESEAKKKLISDLYAKYKP